MKKVTKNLIKIAIVGAFFVIAGNNSFAQAPPPPTNSGHGSGGNQQSGGGAPISGGAGMLIAFAVAYAGKKTYQIVKKSKNYTDLSD